MNDNRNKRRPVTAGEAPILLRDTEAARLLGIGRTKLWALMQSGQLEVVRIGQRSTRITRSSVMKLAGAAQAA